MIEGTAPLGYPPIHAVYRVYWTGLTLDHHGDNGPKQVGLPEPKGYTYYASESLAHDGISNAGRSRIDEDGKQTAIVSLYGPELVEVEPELYNRVMHSGTVHFNEGERHK